MNVFIIYWTQRFYFSSLLRRGLKFVKWRLPCISHFVGCPNEKTTGHSFSMKKVSGIAYRDMIQKYLFSQLNEFVHQEFIWLQDGAPLYFLLLCEIDWTMFPSDGHDVPIQMTWFTRVGLGGLPISHHVISFCGGVCMYLPTTATFQPARLEKKDCFFC